MLLVVLIATASCDSTESDEPIDFREKSTVIRATPDDPPPSATPVSGAITLPPDSDWNWQLTGELKMTVNAEVLFASTVRNRGRCLTRSYLAQLVHIADY